MGIDLLFLVKLYKCTPGSSRDFTLGVLFIRRYYLLMFCYGEITHVLIVRSK